MSEKEKVDKLLGELKAKFDAQEARNKTTEEYKIIAKKYILEQFNSNILYWVDGYDKIIKECGITDQELRSELLGKLRKHQEEGISKWIDFSLEKN